MTALTLTLTPTAALRNELVARAHVDLHDALARVLPFVLHHPEEASILTDLGRIASATPDGDDAFRRVITSVLAAVARTEAEPGPSA